MLQSQSYLEKGTINQLQSPTSSCSLDIYFSFTKDISNPKHFHSSWVEFSFRTSLTLLQWCSDVTAGTWILQKTKARLAWASQPPQFGNSLRAPPKVKQVVPVPLPCCARAPGCCPCPAVPPWTLPAGSSCFRTPGNHSLHLFLPADPTLGQFYSFILDGTACTSIILCISHRNAFLDCFKDVLGTCNPGRKSSRDCTFPSAIHFKKSQI